MRFVPASCSTAIREALPAGGTAILRLAVLLAAVFHAGQAAADFRLCNNTSSRVGIAIGYKDAGGWVTEGWWNLPPRRCETILRGTLVARFYYVYAIDYDRGGEWSGQAYLCTRPKEFTIHGTDNCLARGFDRTGFFEIDTGEQRAWTVQLTESAQQPVGSKATTPMPMLTIPQPGAAAPVLPPPATIGPATR
jgi:uncharacterized membrane protein